MTYGVLGRTNGESCTIQLSLQPSVSGWHLVSLLVSRLTVDISNTFRGVFKVRRVKLMLRISEFREFYRILLFCLPLNITSLKRFTRYGHYAGKVEDRIIGRVAVFS